MGARSMFKRRIPLWTAAVLLGSGLTAARADDDTFFSDLAKADAAPARTADAPPGAVATPPVVAAVQPAAKPVPSTGALLQKGLKPGDTTGAIAPRQVIDRSEWVPEHAASPASPAKPAPAPTKPQAASAKPADKADPEPDVAIAPPAEPSKDPLDHPAVPVATSVPAPEALPPLNAAMKAALDKRDGEPVRGPGAGERRKERAAVSFFYAAHGFAPVWSTDGKPVEAVPSVLARLAKAGDDALTLPSPAPKALKVEGTPEEIVAAELALTDAVVAYARQASGSRVDPKGISPLIGSLPTLADPAEVLDTVSGAAADAGDKLSALNPAEPRYVALREKLAELHAKRRPAKTAGKLVPSGPTLHVGMRDKRVPALRARLGAAAGFGDDTDNMFDSGLSEALADWQRSNELPTSGALDKRTLAALNGDTIQPSSRQEGTLIANMEMWRWMPRDLGADRIEVNIPDYAVRVFHDGRVVDEHRVVVGKTDTPTPLFSNAMKYLIVNPYWNVPQSIIKKEMLPKGGGSLSYLAGRGYEVGTHNGMATVKQLPGPKNALGQIKFLFPNDYSVYLHDTPSKSLFAASKRAFSHGCVRVDKPFAFAESVLNDVVPEGTRSRWSQDKLEGMVGDKERYVNFAKPLPIHIEYFTASIEDGGRINRREDVYGYAHAVATALGQDSDPAPIVKPKEPKPAVIAERPRRRAVVEADVDPGYAAAPPVERSGGGGASFWSGLFDPR